MPRRLAKNPSAPGAFLLVLLVVTATAAGQPATRAEVAAFAAW